LCLLKLLRLDALLLPGFHLFTHRLFDHCAKEEEKKKNAVVDQIRLMTAAFSLFNLHLFSPFAETCRAAYLLVHIMHIN
jgi:hypothetical protein